MFLETAGLVQQSAVGGAEVPEVDRLFLPSGELVGDEAQRTSSPSVTVWYPACFSSVICLAKSSGFTPKAASDEFEKALSGAIPW